MAFQRGGNNSNCRDGACPVSLGAETASPLPTGNQAPQRADLSTKWDAELGTKFQQYPATRPRRGPRVTPDTLAPESRKNWIAALDRLAALNPTTVVAGHKKPGAPDSPSTIQDTKRYLQDFDRLQKTATSDQELFDQMTELYPHWVANQSWLMFGFPQP